MTMMYVVRDGAARCRQGRGGYGTLKTSIFRPPLFRRSTEQKLSESCAEPPLRYLRRRSIHAALLRACRRKQLAERLGQLFQLWLYLSRHTLLSGRCTGQCWKGVMPRAKGVTMHRAKKSKVDGGGPSRSAGGRPASVPLLRRPKNHQLEHLQVPQMHRTHQLLLCHPPLFALTRRRRQSPHQRPILRHGSPHPPILHLEAGGATARRCHMILSHHQLFGRGS